MPIQLEQPIKALSEQEFHDLDFQVMRLAFDIQNQLGRFYDEKIYQKELLRACLINGIQANAEVKICLAHKAFKKDLFIDLLLNYGAIYELKTASAIASDYQIQALDYLLLTEIKHGKIVNFRPPSVEHEFVSTTLDFTARRNVKVDDNLWLHHSETADKLKSITLEILADWGAFLNTALYKEAICYFFGGQENIIQPVRITTGEIELGTQKIPLLSQTETFCISSLKNGIPAYRKHLQRFLDHTDLDTLYWINLNGSEIQFSSVSNSNHSVLNYSDLS
ncbi:MAG: GxxExxY protein [Kiritimatiellales bacterium]